MTIEHFKQIDSKYVTYEGINQIIDDLFPEYVADKSYYDQTNKDLPYIHLGCLSLMALKNLDTRTDTDLASRLLEMTNHVINEHGSVKRKDGRDDLQNLFGIEVFENLSGYVKGATLAKQYLTDEALQSFHATTLHYHTDEFLQEYYKVFDNNPIYVKDPESLYSYMWNDLKRPGMNSPEDDELLWDIRTKLEIDEDLIAGTLSYLTSTNKPPEVQIKNFYGLQKALRNYREELNNHKPSDKNKPYVKDLLSFIDDLERISSNTSIWMWNHGIK